MARIRRLASFDEDLVEVLRYTLDTFGLHQYDRYKALVLDALDAIASQPTLGLARPDVNPEARAFHIRQPGKRARHFIFFRIVSTADGDVVEAVALLHDAMNLPRHWPLA